MRKVLKKVLFLMFGMVSLGASAQMEQMTQPLPIDDQVRHGVLDNGLTYYIRHNETPKGQADFYIAQKVGSILEEDNQRGLAHFLEHMCFNGTKNFPGNNVIQWLETVGVKFGVNLNAYTSVDETVYNISNVPITRESVQDSCLLILHDWSHNLLLETEEINKERGVIHEEWRSRNVGQQRILETLLPKIYPNSKYGYRMPIGTMDVVDNFEPQALRDYYATWYRPDQQGIIVVGDIDVDRIEAKIKELFTPIAMPENAKERTYESVPDNEGTIYAIGSDPEQQYSIFNIYFKCEQLPKEMSNSLLYMMTDYITDMMTNMLSNRYNEMSSNPDTPFAAAFSNYGNFLYASTCDVLSIGGVSKGDDILPSLKSVYRELLRAVRGGFTASEYDRARSEYLSRLELAYNNRNNVETEKYSREIVRHFIDNVPMTGIETEYNMMNALANQIPVEAINQTLQQLVTENNRVVLLMQPEKEGLTLPTEEALAQAMKEVDAENIEAFVDEVKAEPLIPSLPKAGKIVSEKHNDQWDATELTLSNGVKVLVKHTDFKADEILFSAQAIGGTSEFADSYANSLIFFPVAAQSAGLGDYTNKDLTKYLQGKQVGISLSFDTYEREIAGQSSPKDLQTLMELIYMNFTNFNYNADEFLATQKSYAGIIKNQETNPQYIFSRDMTKALYENPRRQAMSVDAVNGATLDQTVEIARKMTANAADYTFFFVGNVDLDALRPLLTQYIATLPANKAKATTAPKYNKALGIRANLPAENRFTAPMQTPQTFVAVLDYGKIDYTPKTRAAANIAGQILTKRLLATVREDMGAVYSIWASGNMQRVAQDHNAMIQSVFPMKPEMKQQVFDFIAQEFKNMESNITDDELATVIEYMIKNAQEDREKNDAWLNAMTGTLLNGVDTFNGAEATYRSMTVADVQNFMKELNKQGNYKLIYLDAE
jgi:zinc protease